MRRNWATEWPDGHGQDPRDDPEQESEEKSEEKTSDSVATELNHQCSLRETGPFPAPD